MATISLSGRFARRSEGLMGSVGSSSSRSPRRPATLVATAALLALSLMGVAPVAATAAETPTWDDRDLLLQRHVDAVHAAWVDDALAIQVVDGQTPRPADEVAIRLGPDADDKGREVSRMLVPDDANYAFIGKPGDIVWTAPQKLFAGWVPVWAGIGTGAMPAEIDPSSIRTNLISDGGPGDMEVFFTSYDGTIDRFFSSTDAAYKSVPQTPGAHGHFTWTFSKPGRYDTQWQVTAITTDGTQVSSPVTTVIWLVGTDSEVGLPEGSYPGHEITVPADAASTDPTDPVDEPTDPAPDPDPAPGSKPFNPTKWSSVPENNVCTHVAAGHIDMRARYDTDNDLEGFARWDNPKGQAEELKSRKFALEVSEKAKTTIPHTAATQELRNILRTDEAYQLPANQDVDLPWFGFSTEELQIPEDSRSYIDMYSFQGPSENARFALGEYNSLGRQFEIDIDSQNNWEQKLWLNTPAHVHKAMFFSEPGFYSIDFAINIVNADGSGTYAGVELWFAVGNDAVSYACERTGVVEPDPTDPVTDPGADPVTDPGADPDTTPELPDSGSSGPDAVSAGDKHASTLTERTLPRTGPAGRQGPLMAAAVAFLVGFGLLRLRRPRER